jgi:flagellar basal body rod protein FlgG
VPFFSVETSSGPAYTRCGRLEIDEQRRLAIRGAEGLCPLVPEVVIPEGCHALKIHGTGHILPAQLTGQNRKAGGQVVESPLGQIQLVTFLDASQLKYDQHGWLRATDGSGPAALVETWLLRPGHLETSNVEVKDEQAQLRWVEELARHARPVVPAAGDRLMEPGPLADDRESASGLP